MFKANPGDSRMIPAKGKDAEANAWVFYYFKSKEKSISKVRIKLGWNMGDATDSLPLVDSTPQGTLRPLQQLEAKSALSLRQTLLAAMALLATQMLF